MNERRWASSSSWGERVLLYTMLYFRSSSPRPRPSSHRRMQPWRPYRGPLVAQRPLPVLPVKVDLPAPHRRSLGPWTCRGSWRVSLVTAMLQLAYRRDDKDLLHELRRPPPRHELRTGEARERT